MDSGQAISIFSVPQDVSVAASFQDRREVLRRLPISEQWKLIAVQPRYMRAWHLAAGTCSAILVLIVYVYGWRRHGASTLLLLPPSLYSAFAFATMLAFNTIGMISPVNALGPLQGVIQMFYFTFPLFQPVSKVDTACPVCSSCIDTLALPIKLQGHNARVPAETVWKHSCSSCRGRPGLFFYIDPGKHYVGSHVACWRAASYAAG